MKNTYKNHVAICLDTSGSMSGIIGKAVEVFNNQIDFLRSASLSFDQETRVSFYTFGSNVECVINDVDVARPIKLEAIHATGQTALMDCVALAINDAKELPQKYGDHSFLLYVITDGEENNSHISTTQFRQMLNTLPDNFSVAAFVPSINSVTLMHGLGFPKGNIEKWDTTQKGIEEVGQKFAKTIDNYFTSRASGVRSSNTIFSDLSQVTSKTVNQVLDKITNYEIVINESVKAVQIKDLVEDKLHFSYIKGNSYYELVKNEHVQAGKHIAVQNKKTGDVYTGSNARKLLNLPNNEVKIVPGDFGEWIVYVQSTSVNRNVIPKQRILVLK